MGRDTILKKVWKIAHFVKIAKDGTSVRINGMS
jgi:hypothetical protein